MVSKAFIKLVSVCSLLVFALFLYQRLSIIDKKTVKKSYQASTAGILDTEQSEVTTASLHSIVDSGDPDSIPFVHSATAGTANSEDITIEEKVEKCMRMANLNSELLLTQARDNARYYVDEYRKVIPAESLPGHRSHCWHTEYTAKWTRSSRQMSGHIGNVSYNFNKLPAWPYSNNIFPLKDQQMYTSNTVCLPNVFVIGHEKCGSTFLFTVIDNLISMSTNNWKKRQIYKEPMFWAIFEAYKTNHKHIPKATDFFRYLIYYIPAGADLGF